MDSDHFVQLVQVKGWRHATAGAAAIAGDRAQVGVIVEDGLHVVAGTEGDQVRVVSRRRDRNRASAPDVGMTQLIGET